MCKKLAFKIISLHPPPNILPSFSGKASERDSPIWCGGEQYISGVSVSFSSGHSQVALSKGRKKESGKEEKTGFYFCSLKSNQYYTEYTKH